jgi:hypothetical protein
MYRRIPWMRHVRDLSLQELLRRLSKWLLVSTGVQVLVVRVHGMIAPAPRMVHIAIGRLASAALAEVASPVVVADDNLLLGPSRAGLKRHQAARARYWGGSPSPELHEELARTSSSMLCVELPPTPSGLLSLCQVCSAAIERGREVLVVDLGAESSGAYPQALDPAHRVHIDAEEASRHRPPAARWSKLETALAATLWRLWCRRSPVAFSRFCASGSALHPQIANLSRYHAGLFPRAVGPGISLSRLDELILRQLSREWSTPARVFRNAMAAGSELDAWISHTGDLHLAARLLAWSRHTRGRIVERRREHPVSSAEMTTWSFRWRAGGEAILDRLPTLGAAPPLAVGGAVAYDPDRRWVGRLDVAGRPYVSRLATGSARPDER